MIQSVYSKFNEVSLRKVFEFLGNLNLDDLNFDNSAMGDNSQDISNISPEEKKSDIGEKFGNLMITKQKTSMSQDMKILSKSKEALADAKLSLKIPLPKNKTPDVQKDST